VRDSLSRKWFGDSESQRIYGQCWILFMTSLFLIALLFNFSVQDSQTINRRLVSIENTSHGNRTEFVMLIMQDRIVLKQGAGGGVSTRSDFSRANRSYSHSSRPLFGPQASHAAKHSSSRYSPPAPLVTSREVARESVRRSIYGNRWSW
jgi:hypothetical protein